MTDFLLRDIDHEVLEKLRERAECNGRSLQAEIKQTLKASVRLSKAESLALLERVRGEIGPSASDSTQLIREFRDSR